MSKFGFSWSWKRAIGLTSAKSRLSREIGIPLTKSGRDRKVGAWLLGDAKHHAHEHEHTHHSTHRRRYHAHIGWGMVLTMAALYVYNLVAGKNVEPPANQDTAAQSSGESR